jgi:hypothetical protein
VKTPGFTVTHLKIEPEKQKSSQFLTDFFLWVIFVFDCLHKFLTNFPSPNLRNKALDWSLL